MNCFFHSLFPSLPLDSLSAALPLCGTHSGMSLHGATKHWTCRATHTWPRGQLNPWQTEKGTNFVNFIWFWPGTHCGMGGQGARMQTTWCGRQASPRGHSTPRHTVWFTHCALPLTTTQSNPWRQSVAAQAKMEKIHLPYNEQRHMLVINYCLKIIKNIMCNYDYDLLALHHPTPPVEHTAQLGCAENPKEMISLVRKISPTLLHWHCAGAQLWMHIMSCGPPHFGSQWVAHSLKTSFGGHS